MPLITVSQFLGLTDAIAAHYNICQPALDSGTAKTLELNDEIVGGGGFAGLQDYTNIAQFGQHVATLLPLSSSAGYYGPNGSYPQILRDWQTGIQNLGSTVSTSIQSIDSFATYYNGVTAWSCLYSWQFALIYNLIYPTLRLSPGNVFPPGGATGIQLATGTITAASTTSFVAGSTIPTANTSSVQGYAGAYLEAEWTANMNASGTLTVTGKDQSGTVQTWTVPIGGEVSGTVVESTTTTKRISQVTGVAVSGAVTSGAWALRAKQERIIS